MTEAPEEIEIKRNVMLFANGKTMGESGLKTPVGKAASDDGPSGSEHEIRKGPVRGEGLERDIGFQGPHDREAAP